MKYTTLLLDLDETLFDFSKSEKFAIDKLMEKYNIPVTEENRRLYSKTAPWPGRRFQIYAFRGARRRFDS